MNDSIKRFIEENIELIETKKFELLYNLMYTEWKKHSIKIRDISEFTDILTKVFDEEPIFNPDVTFVPNYYRAHDDKIKHIEIPEGIEYIGKSAFRNCINLEYVKLPKTLSHINNEAFKGCDSLNNIFYNGTINDWKKIKLGIQPFGSNSWSQKHIIIYCNDGEIRI